MVTLRDEYGGARRERFAQGVLALERDPAHPMAPSIFNMALTNALVEIASCERRPCVSGDSRRLPSASCLLRDLKDVVVEGVDYDVLSAAVRSSDPARHGHLSVDPIPQAAVDVLAALDRHPALHALDDATLNVDWVFGEAAVTDEEARATEYAAELDDNEQQRRAEAALEAGPWDIEDRLIEPEVQDCPVCGYESLLPRGDDWYGYGVVAGVCFVCSYRRSKHEA